MTNKQRSKIIDRIYDLGDKTAKAVYEHSKKW
jgi:hypothetical protein